MYESSAKSLILHLRLLVPLHKLLPPNPARSSNQVRVNYSRRSEKHVVNGEYRISSCHSLIADGFPFEIATRSRAG